MALNKYFISIPSTSASSDSSSSQNTLNPSNYVIPTIDSNYRDPDYYLYRENSEELIK